MQFLLLRFLTTEDQKGVNEKWQIIKQRNIKETLIFDGLTRHIEKIAEVYLLHRCPPVIAETGAKQRFSR